MIRAARWAAACATTLLAAGAAGAQTTLYEQPPVPPAGGFSLWASDQGNDGTGFRSFDQFTIGASGALTGARWRGTYFDVANAGNNPVAPDETSWDVTFWAGGTPDVVAGPLATRSLSTADVTRTFVGFGTFQGSPVPIYDYETTFAAWAFTGGATYSFSVLAHSPAYNPVWAWMQGTGGNSQMWQQPLPGTALISRSSDRAFALVGTTVPEPGSLALVATGAAVLVGAATRRGRRA